MRVVISGTVGIGKSTTTNLLVNKLAELGYDVAHLDEKTVESVYLDYYYKKPEEWAYLSQLDFVSGRFKQFLEDEKERETNKSEKRITIYDRHPLDDLVFAELHSVKRSITEMNSITYHAVYKEMIEKINYMDAKPDYFILLTAPLEVVMERLNKRARDAEMGVDMAYWEDLYNNYYNRPVFQNHFEKNTKKVVKIDTSSKTPEEIVDEIIKIIENKE